MGFWKRLGNSLKIAAAVALESVALESVATTAVSDKPITVGNVGRDAAKVVIHKRDDGKERAAQEEMRRS